MSHDGCIEVAWKGKAFPFLMHHPNSFLQTENYGSKRQAEAGHSAGHASQGSQHGSDSMAPAGTGTWNGPAPRGYMRDGVNAAATASQSTVTVQQPSTTRIGTNGALMPLLGLGTVAIESPDVIKTALELGYRHIDCASFYQNQEVVGAGLADFIAAGRREELFIVSKLWMNERRPEIARASFEKTLSQLGCQYLDLYLVHWPEAQVPGVEESFTGDVLTEDKTVTIMDTWRVLEELVDAGKIKNIGVSNFSVKQVEELLSQCRIRPACNQVELHPLLAQRKLVGVCFRKGVQCVAYSPLGGQGRVGPASTLLTHPVVQQVAKEAGKTTAQVLLRWNMQRGVPVIPKSGSAEHLKENIEGAFDWQLSQEQKSALDSLDCGFRFVAPKWKVWADPEEGGAAKPSLVMA